MIVGRRKSGAVFGSTLGLALAMAAGVAGLGASVGAEEIGDLYAAVPTGVLELYVASASVVNTVPLAPAPRLLAFSPDGHELYAVTGTRHVVRIDVESITTSDPIALPATATALAYPKGDELAIALPASRTIGLLAEGDTSVSQSSVLPGAVDLVTADGTVSPGSDDPGILQSSGDVTFNANSAYPFENPTGFSNFVEMLLILVDVSRNHVEVEPLRRLRLAVHEQ